VSNPFGNPYEAEYPASQAGPGQPELDGSHGYIPPPPLAAPQPYLAANQLPRPVAPRNVTIAVGLLLVLAVFLVPPVLNQLKNDLPWALFGIPVIINVALALGLSKRPGKVVQALTTAYAGLWCLTGVGLLASVPMIVLLWTQEAKDYFAAGERWNTTRTAANQRR